MIHPSRTSLLLSLERALTGNVHSALRQASVEADQAARIVKLRFEYDENGYDGAKELCSVVATEVIADFPSPWSLEEEHLPTSHVAPLRPLAWVAYRRGES